MKITIVIKEPGQGPYSKQIEDKLEVYKEILGGHLECVSFDEQMVLLCNDEGKFQGLQPNLSVPGDVIVGTVIVVGTAGEEFRSLTPAEISAAIQKLNRYAI